MYGMRVFHTRRLLLLVASKIVISECVREYFLNDFVTKNIRRQAPFRKKYR